MRFANGAACRARVLVVIFCLFAGGVSAMASSGYQWREGEPLPPEGLANPFDLPARDLAVANRNGRIHALNYPVTVTGALLPFRPIKGLLEHTFGSFDVLGKWMGLYTYPAEEGIGPYFIPFSNGQRPSVRMGVSLVHSPQGGVGVTFSCAACHSANLFGRRVIGLTNRFPRANEMYVKGKKGLRLMPSKVFKALTGANKQEVAMYLRTKENLRSVEAKMPRRAGLDTSLAHVALSLSHRAKDEWATYDPKLAKHPRAEVLRHAVSDSKPAVWWNVKYKNRWLLDGSVVSGNPIYTNLLWNEIGRGTDLHQLKTWLDENQDIVAELTTAVYQSEPPLITDFFPEEAFDLEAAKRGEKLFVSRCSKCHGTYVKGWSLPGAEHLSWKDQLKTFSLHYFEQTPVKNVGTDPHRRESMRSLLQLNDLKISREQGILIRVQPGYVPPPLLGIWARYPYFHNNSVPSLCEVISPVRERRVRYLAREANDRNRDFDFACNGYPRVRHLTARQKASRYYYDTRKEGLSNSGHEGMFLDDKGHSVFSAQDKNDLVRYLQTL